MKKLTEAFRIAALQVAIRPRMRVLTCLVIVANLELGALAALLEGLLESGRKEVCQVVMDAANEIICQRTGGPGLRERHHLVYRLLRMLKEVKENMAEAASLTSDDRHAMLRDFACEK